MTRAIVIHETGGPDVLRQEDLPVGEPGPGEVSIRHTAIGLNFIDTYQRSGLYPMQTPFVGGNEGAGVVTAVGPDVPEFGVGDRVAYQGTPGAYAEERIAPAQRLVRVPDGISDEVAAGIMLKGLTAYYLLFQTWPVQAGQTLLWHAAAGGTGLIATQWAKALGATVIGTASGVVSIPDLTVLARKGSLIVTRPTSNAYLGRREDLLEGAAALFQAVLDGSIKVEIGRTYRLGEVAAAHRALEGRETTGSVVLLP